MKRKLSRGGTVLLKMLTKPKFVPGVTYEIDPNKNYLVIFEEGTIPKYDLEKLALPSGSVIALVRGDPRAVKVIEEQTKKTDMSKKVTG